MLIPKDKAILYDTHFEGDKQIFSHVQDISQVATSAQEIRHFSDNGFTKSRDFQHIARIPELEALKHPEIFQDEHAMKMYLQGEGRKYCTCDPAGI
jgi:hypothetical protein